MALTEKSAKRLFCALVHIAQEWREHVATRSVVELAEEVGLGKSSLYAYLDPESKKSIPVEVFANVFALASEVDAGAAAKNLPAAFRVLAGRGKGE